MSLGKRIKNIRDYLGLSQENFAKELGVKHYQNIGNWEKDTNYPNDIGILVKISELGNVTLDWLLTGKESTFTPPLRAVDNLPGNAKEVDFTYYPVLTRVMAGDFDLNMDQDNILGFLPLPIKKKNCFLLEVEGDSMISNDKRKSIEPGDYLLVDPTETPVHGDVVVVVVNGSRQMVKQFFLSNGRIELRSYNPDHPPIYIEPENLDIIYRVIYIQPRIRRL